MCTDWHEERQSINTIRYLDIIFTSKKNKKEKNSRGELMMYYLPRNQLSTLKLKLLNVSIFLL
jgi:hypothetical protein